MDNLLYGIGDAKHIRLSLYQPLQYACRLLLGNPVHASCNMSHVHNHPLMPLSRLSLSLSSGISADERGWQPWQPAQHSFSYLPRKKKKKKRGNQMQALWRFPLPTTPSPLHPYLPHPALDPSFRRRGIARTCTSVRTE